MRARALLALLLVGGLVVACSDDEADGTNPPADGSDAGGPASDAAGTADGRVTPPPSNGPDAGDAGDAATTDADADVPRQVTVHFTRAEGDTSPVQVVFYPASGVPEIVPLDERGDAVGALPAGGDVTLLHEQAGRTDATTVLGVQAGERLDLTPRRRRPFATWPRVTVTFAPFPGAISHSFDTGCGSGGVIASGGEIALAPDCVRTDGSFTLVARASTLTYTAYARKTANVTDAGTASMSIAESDWAAWTEVPVSVSGTPAAGVTTLGLGFRIVHGPARESGTSRSFTTEPGVRSVPRAPFDGDALSMIGGSGEAEELFFRRTQLSRGYAVGTGTFAFDLGELLPQASSANVTKDGDTPVVGWTMAGATSFQAATAGRAVIAGKSAAGARFHEWTVLFPPNASLVTRPPALPASLAGAMSAVGAWSLQTLDFSRPSNATYAELTRTRTVFDAIAEDTYVTPGVQCAVSRRESRYLLTDGNDD